MNTQTIIKRSLSSILTVTALVASVNCSNAPASNAALAHPLVTTTNEKTAVDANASTNVVSTAASAQAPDINVEGSFASSNIRRGGIARANVTIDIPGGFHVNANRPLGKYAIPTVLKISAPAGVRVSPVVYPRSMVRIFKFSNEKLAVYEGRAVMRFNVTVPAGFKGDRVEVKANLRFQSCNDEVCFPPKNRDVEIAIDVR